MAFAACVLTACSLPTDDGRADEPLVVFTFDDGYRSIYEVAFPTMQSFDSSWAATHFLPACYPANPALVSVDELRVMEGAGWETGGHGYTHENLSSVPLDTARRQVAASDSFLRANGLRHESYAYAYGNYNDSVQAIVARHFRNIRTSHDKRYLDGVNRLELGAYDAKGGHEADDLIGRVEEARQCGSPLVVFCFHVIVAEDGGVKPGHNWWIAERAFRGLCAYLHDHELPVVNVAAAMEELVGE